jgi:uncharacterized protein YkwD
MSGITGSLLVRAIDVDSASREFFDLTNQVRQQEGLNPLIMDSELMKAAAIRAKELDSLFEHTRPDGTSWSTAVSNDAKTRLFVSAENIAGYSGPASAINALMNSPGHRANILGQSYTHMGVAEALVDGVPYHVQIFAIIK